MNKRANRGKIGKHCKNSKEKTTEILFLRKIILLLACVCMLFTMSIAGGLMYYRNAVKPPEQVTQKGFGSSDSSKDSNGSTLKNETAVREERTYTFLVVGMDDGNGNTDTIMAGKFDAETGSVNIVSIPRDTLVNVPWETKKVNSLYANGGISGLKSGIADIMGFTTDFYVTIDLDAFSMLVDAIGGVWYDVPEDMAIGNRHIAKGYQKLSGEQAEVVMRTRNVYDEADIGRIATQQDFMMAAAKQIVGNKQELSISTLANLFLNYVDTDLSYGNIIWFAQKFLEAGTGSISFSTLPANYWATIYDLSYVCIYPEEWVTMINERLNPFEEDVVLSDLNILTMDADGRIYSTTGVYNDDAGWGNNKNLTGGIY